MIWILFLCTFLATFKVVCALHNVVSMHINVGKLLKILNFTFTQGVPFLGTKTLARLVSELGLFYSAPTFLNVRFLIQQMTGSITTSYNTGTLAQHTHELLLQYTANNAC